MSKKLIALALAGLFVFSVVAPAKAVTVEELQAQITALLAQITTLQQQLAQAQGQTSSGVCFYTDLQQGMTSAEVLKLQQTLNRDPATRVAVSGAGAPGSETTYFGPSTLAAAKAFQAKYGIITTGYVGPLTRAKLNELYCTPTTTTTVAPETTTTTVAPSYGTLSVQTYPVSNPVTTLYGGQTYELLAAQYKATGSDITLRKVAVEVIDSNRNSFPWQAFSTISVWDGSTRLAELPVTSANAIENAFAEDYTFNISGLNWVIPNGTQKVLTVKGTIISGNPVSTVTDGTYTVKLLGSGTVYADTAGVTYTSLSSDITKASLQIAASQSSAITTTVATDNPLEGNIIGSTSATTRVDLLKFNVKVENINSTFNSGTITATSSDDKLVSVELWDGSTLVAAAAPAATTGTVSWTNFTLPVSAGTTKTFTVKGVIAQLTSGYTTGGTVQVTGGPVLTGVDDNSNVITADGASITGNPQHVYLIAPVFTYVSSSVTVKGTNSETNPNDIGDTSITFSVTAHGGDIYIPQKGNSTATEGMLHLVTGGTATTTSSTTWTCASPAIAVGSASNPATTQLWRIPNGQTANCTLSTLVTNTGGTAGYFNVALKSVKWDVNNTDNAGVTTQDWGLTNIKTADFYLGK